jgi:hypothetical protein
MLEFPKILDKRPLSRASSVGNLIHIILMTLQPHFRKQFWVGFVVAAVGWLVDFVFFLRW